MAMARTVPAVVRALDILELFLSGEDRSIPEITATLGLPKTTVHELVNTLVTRTYLVPHPDKPHRYRLGLPLFRLGSVFAEQVDLAREGRVVSEQVAATSQETVHVAVLDGTDVLYVAKADSAHAVRLVSAVGRKLPAHCTAVGKMLLASLSAEDFATRYRKGATLAAMTPRSITSTLDLRERLQEIADRGLAYEYCESNEAAACVAAPVRDRSGRVVAAMSISVPTPRWNEQVGTKLGELVAEGAHRLSAQLGYYD
ncbi:MAG TPA: IclR family transcriptional regulator [Pseudonocardiaceae bacterium]|jgi:DNA-binding IclR family transcriptional regulator|nr:IclR family transcriptional regulator [Pseudonocardiaceae bacterium]